MIGESRFTIVLVLLLLFAGVVLAVVFIWKKPLLQNQKSSAATQSTNHAIEVETYSDEGSGISFSYPADWESPIAEQSGNTRLIKFPSGATVAKVETSEIDDYLGGFALSGFAAKIAEQGNQTIAVSYPENDSDLEEGAQIIVDTIEVSTTTLTDTPSSPNPTDSPENSTDTNTAPSPIPTRTQLFSTPTPTPSIHPIPDPTLFYQQSGECTYGCVPKQRF